MITNQPDSDGDYRDDLKSRFKVGTISLPNGIDISKHHKNRTSFTTFRQFVHRSNKIKVRTTYSIEIDGEPLTMHTSVSDDGSVHCHGLPNYSFPSALDMARALVDAAILAEIPKDELGSHRPRHKEDDQ